MRKNGSILLAGLFILNAYFFILANVETAVQDALPAEPVGESSSWLLHLSCLAVGAVVSVFAGWWASRFLIDREIDPLLLPPWKPYSDKFSEGWQPSRILGRIIALNGILLTISVVLRWREIWFFAPEELLKFSGQVWLLLLTSLVALAIARFIAATVITVFDNQTIRNQLELMFPHSGGAVHGQEKAEATAREMIPFARSSVARETFSPAKESFADTVARIVGMVIYFIVFIPVFMIAAEIWGWSATGNTLGEIWRWLLPFTGLAVTVLIGWFILTALVLSFSPPEQRRTVMVATSVLALILLTASFNLVFAITFALVLAVGAWLTRNDLPDAFAGFYLQMQRELAVKTADGPGKVVAKEFLVCEVSTLNGRYRVRNRYVLRSYLDGQMIEEARMVKI